MRRALVLVMFTALTLTMLSFGRLPAVANDAVQVTWRKAQIMSFGPGVSGIIIGDPSVIDVTLEGSGQIVVFGKVPGETNMMVLGADNSVLFDAPIVVMPEDDRHVSIISPGDAVITERSWNCLSRCVQVLGPGGIRYTSVRAMGGSPSAAPATGGAAEGGNADAAAAAGQTAQDIANMNRATSQGAGGVPSQTGLVAPY